MKTELTELPESRVAARRVGRAGRRSRKRMDRAAKQMAGEMKLPGLSQGQGAAAAGDPADRPRGGRSSRRPRLASRVVRAGDRRVRRAHRRRSEARRRRASRARARSLEFSIEVGVRPRPTLGEYRGLEVGKAEVEVPEDAVAEELERLREGFGSLNPVERPAAENGDVVVIDYEGTVDGEPFEGRHRHGHDDRARIGAPPARVRGRSGRQERRATKPRSRRHLPRRLRPEDLAGKAAVFTVKVKEVREKELPELDDDFAAVRIRVRHAGRAARGDPLAHGGDARGSARRRVPRRGGRSRSEQRDGRPAPRPRPRPGARAVGALRAHARGARHRPADVRADAGQGPPRR